MSNPDISKIFCVRKSYHNLSLYKKYIVLQEMTDWAESQREKLLEEYVREKRQSIRN